MQTIPYFLEQLDEPNKTSCIALHQYFLTYCKDAKGSSHNHQNRPGGYFDHVKEILNYGEKLYTMMDAIQKLPFTFQDAILVLFLHDIEKPIKYTTNTDETIKNLQTKTNNEIRDYLLHKFSFVLTPEHRNALRYIHGEGNDYSGQKRVMGPLAAFCHICDIMSARIFFERI